MKYHAMQPKFNVLFALAFSFAMMTITLYDYLFLTILFFFSIVFCIVSLLLRYELLIEDEEMIYKIIIFNKVLYTKHLYSREIQQIKFKRYGWATAGATIVIKGLNLRIISFEPKEVLLHLELFANVNNLKLVKTKDYLNLKKNQIT